MTENIARLGAVDEAIKNLGLTDSNGRKFTEYSAEAESATKLAKEQAQRGMEENRADHVIANNKQNKKVCDI